MDDIVAEYHANARRHERAVECLATLRAAERDAPPNVRPHLDRALAAAEGAFYGYNWRDDELHAEAVRAGKWADIMATVLRF